MARKYKTYKLRERRFSSGKFTFKSSPFGFATIFGVRRNSKGRYVSKGCQAAHRRKGKRCRKK